MDNKLNHTVTGPRDQPFARGITQRNTIGHPTRPHTSTTSQRTTVGPTGQHQGGGRVAMTLDSDFRRLNMATDQGDETSKKGKKAYRILDEYFWAHRY